MSEFLKTHADRCADYLKSEKYGQKAERESGIKILRIYSGLKPINEHNKSCLRCEKKFKSQGGWHRMCDYCRDFKE